MPTEKKSKAEIFDFMQIELVSCISPEKGKIHSARLPDTIAFPVASYDICHRLVEKRNFSPVIDRLVPTLPADYRQMAGSCANITPLTSTNLAPLY